MTHRFSRARAVVEALVLAPIMLLAGVLVALSQGWPFGPHAGGLLWLVSVALLYAIRWSCRITIDETGLTKSSLWAGMSLPWRDVCELQEVRNGADDPIMRVVASGGRRISITSGYVESDRLRGRVRQLALQPIRAALQRELEVRGTMTFRHPGSRWVGHVEYFVTLCGLGGLGAGTWALLKSMPSVEGSVALLAGIAVGVLVAHHLLSRARTVASWHGAVVALDEDGLDVRKLDGALRIPWSGISGVWRTVDGHLQVDRGESRPLKIPGTIANVVLLEMYARAEVERRADAHGEFAHRR